MSDQKNKLAAKKAAVLEKEKRKMVPALIAIVLIIMVAAGVMTLLNNSKNHPVAFSTESEKDSVTQITYPVDIFQDGIARHFEYKEGSVTIRYFVLKSSDGIIRAAFDACDVCWPSGKGYIQDKDEMICVNCGKRFPSTLINEVKGGCNPEPLVRKVSGDNLIIRVEDILHGKKYFDF